MKIKKLYPIVYTDLYGRMVLLHRDGGYSLQKDNHIENYDRNGCFTSSVSYGGGATSVTAVSYGGAVRG